MVYVISGCPLSAKNLLFSLVTYHKVSCDFLKEKEIEELFKLSNRTTKTIKNDYLFASILNSILKQIGHIYDMLLLSEKGETPVFNGSALDAIVYFKLMTGQFFPGDERIIRLIDKYIHTFAILSSPEERKKQKEAGVIFDPSREWALFKLYFSKLHNITYLPSNPEKAIEVIKTTLDKNNNETKK